LESALPTLSDTLESALPTLSEKGASDLTKEIEAAQEIFKISQESFSRLANGIVFVNCLTNIDGSDSEAKKAKADLQQLDAKLDQAIEAQRQFLIQAGDDVIAAYNEDPFCGEHAFLTEYSRKQRDFALPLGEEKLISGLATNGIKAWGSLYSNISASFRCTIKTKDGEETVGITEAIAKLKVADRELREAAWNAIQEAWKSREDTCATILNSISGWRTEIYQKRSTKRPVHFLDQPLYDNRIERETLEAMMAAVEERKVDSQEIVTLQAKALGGDSLAPWDMSAPAPMIEVGEEKSFSFDEAIQIVADAYAQGHPEMGDFVKMAHEKRWIDGRVLSKKKPGAYCTTFAKSRTPRVFLSYSGSMGDIRTLAHELGHAYHAWVVRDLSLSLTHYPMTLAETASVYGETLVRDGLAQTTQDRNLLFKTEWEDMRVASLFLLNIPARFEIERELYENRGERAFSPEEFKELTGKSFERYYGTTLKPQPQMAWASTLHYYLTYLSFYNFPYIFGYLFSLGIYALRKKNGPEFHQTYVNLLRDTGRMTAEDCAQKHLGYDIRKVEFWRESLNIVFSQKEEFKRKVESL
jgi:oligoendopeptidase F